VVIITATSFEQDLLRREMVNTVAFTEARKSCISGVLGKFNVLLVESGIGAVNCSHSLTHLLPKYEVSQVWQIGVGGGYPQSGVSIGDIAIAVTEHYGDIGVRVDDGWVGLEDSINIPILFAEQHVGDHDIFNGFDYDELYDLDSDPNEMINLIDSDNHKNERQMMIKLYWEELKKNGYHSIYNLDNNPIMKIIEIGPNA